MRRLGKFVVFVAAAVALTIMFAPAANAVDEASSAVVVGGEHVFTIPIAVWNLVVGGLLPFVTAFLVKVQGRNGVKILINLLLSAVTGLVGTAVVAGGTAVLSSTSIVNAGMTFALSTLAYVGVYKPVRMPEAIPGTNKGFG